MKAGSVVRYRPRKRHVSTVQAGSRREVWTKTRHWLPQQNGGNPKKEIAPVNCTGTHNGSYPYNTTGAFLRLRIYGFGHTEL